MAEYSKLPANAALDVKPFKAHVDQDKFQLFKKLLELSPIAPPTFENTNADTKFGVTRNWLVHAKDVWLNNFNWRECEDRINSYPNFTAPVKDAAGNTIEMQFLALFSEKADAIPIAFLHGWPGSICEFLDMLDVAKSKYSPQDLPYHIIVPSHPGYAYSSGPPLDKDYTIETAAGAINSLMVGLGFESGYYVQGGDLGSFLSRALVMMYDSCKGMHVNQMGIPPLKDPAEEPTDPQEKRALQRAKDFIETEIAFVFEQGTKAATVGHMMSSSPLALLSWIGEKVMAWTDGDFPLEKILEGVTLYWMTDTMPRCLYHNRCMGDPAAEPHTAGLSYITGMKALDLPFVEKPCGYSMFSNEIIPVPKSWAAQSVNLVSFNSHEKGGHFAAMERPHELFADVEEYLRVVQMAT